MAATDSPDHISIDTFIPTGAEVDFENTLVSHLQAFHQYPKIQQHTLLFFDELVTVYIVSQSRCCDELQSLLRHASVQLDAFVIHSPDATTPKDTPKRHLIYSTSVPNVDDPDITVHCMNHDKSAIDHIFLIWKVHIHLQRPQTHQQNHYLLLIASASFKTLSSNQAIEDDYLPRLTPASLNVFQPLKTSFPISHERPYLPASRLLHVSPTATGEERVINISQSSENPIRIIFVSNLTMSYSQRNLHDDISIQAILEYEVTSAAVLEVSLDLMDLNLAGGIVRALGQGPTLETSFSCRSGDDITFVFELVASGKRRSPTESLPTRSALDIVIHASVLVSGNVRRKLLTHWKTNVDFSFLSGSQPLSNKELSQNSGLHGWDAMPGPKCALEPIASCTTPFSKGNGVYVSFTSPTHNGLVHPFDLEISAVNRSQQIRKLAVVAAPPSMEPIDRSLILQGGPSLLMPNAFADPVAKEAAMLSMTRHAATLYDIGLLPMHQDVSLSPLFPRSCSQKRLPMSAFVSGIQLLKTLKIIDLETQESIGIQYLPEVSIS